MRLLSSDLFSNYPDISAHFTTRHGGISTSPYGTLNLAFHVGDNIQNVLDNHRILGKALNYDHKRLIHMRQIHSDTVMTADVTMDFESPPQCDAVITDRLNLPLMVMSADCTPILLYDPRNHATGAVHAGRAGALNRILPKTLHAMQKSYGTALSDIHIVMGPSIHGCCYEINEHIAAEVEDKGYEAALIRKKGNIALDVNTILLLQLKELGVPAEHIEVASQCTSCQCKDYFSYRADTQHTGRIAGVILLRPLPS